MTNQPEPSRRPHHRDDGGVNTAEPAPLDGKPDFAAILEEMVADHAPRLFAVVQESSDRADGRIAAWGMAFAEHAEIVSVEHTQRMSLQAPENALRLFTVDNHIRARLVWPNPNETTPGKDHETP